MSVSATRPYWRFSSARVIRQQGTGEGIKYAILIYDGLSSWQGHTTEQKHALHSEYRALFRWARLEKLVVLDVHRTYMGGLQRGDRNLTLRSLERFADGLGGDATDLPR